MQRPPHEYEGSGCATNGRVLSRRVTPLTGDYLCLVVHVPTVHCVKSQRWRKEEEDKNFPLVLAVGYGVSGKRGLHNLHIWRLEACLWSELHKL